MKKLIKILMIGLLVLGVGGAILGHATPADAATYRRVKTMPKNLRHTWFNDDGHKLKIKKKTAAESGGFAMTAKFSNIRVKYGKYYTNALGYRVRNTYVKTTTKWYNAGHYVGKRSDKIAVRNEGVRSELMFGNSTWRLW